MIVYADVFIFTNTLINLVLLTLSAHFNKVQIKYIFLLISAFSGAVLSVAAILKLSYVALYIAKFIIPVIMCIICTNSLALKQQLKMLLTYLISSFILSGVMMCIKQSALITEELTISLTAIICSVLIFALIYKVALRFLINNFKQRNNYFNITLCHKNITLNILGFNDNGNSLVYGTDETPVFICDKEVLEPIISKFDICYDDLICTTVTGSNLIKVFKPDCVYINNQKINAIVGISPIPLNTDYDILFNYENVKFNETEKNYV